MPIFNAEKHLKLSLDSIVNQSIGVENLQVILINDNSTDNTNLIINDYVDNYDNFLAIHLEENIGGAYGPRNIGLKYATGEYLMFLDSDDSYELDACEILYNKISSTEYGNLDLVFGRYKRIYPNFNDTGENLVLKSYSPYEDNMYRLSNKNNEENIYNFKDDIIGNPNLSSFFSFLWKTFFVRFIYGKKKKMDSNEIYLKNINKDLDILKILPSIWTKIYKTDFIINNKIEFSHFISGEDLNFVIEAYFKANGILFLNDTFINNYYMRDSEEDKSITKKISFKLVFDSLKAYKTCSDLCNDYNFKYSDIILNPFLLNWIQIFSKFKGSVEEKEKLLKLAKEMKKSYKNGFKAKLLMSLVIFLIKRSSTL
ncbi:glycosyltransferase [Methanobrevibacter sp. TMH8]|uniref:glycosyltransferase family 2 protein n=1 Tax=Methanobrevibacter sp. TMH8 TaxID=2848611 RepID=UPI001CCF1B03|nr:glycosyltransferase family 2 protein [Methanobrevibacter sp. TMH8]MBZ9570679.1 glycosyltransferase [Methanobrevibacter sp. TMH8]